MTDFTLHERLAADTVEIERWPLSLVLLMNARQWPWLILVPQRPGLRDLHDVPTADHTRLMTEITLASQMLQRLFGPDKINVAALGNVVPQLHIHVIARHTTDPAWPRPVWSGDPPARYDPVTLAARIDQLRKALPNAAA
jgi:diadenosine tetraphosphate (Ap4A) HIT family hydrolase